MSTLELTEERRAVVVKDAIDSAGYLVRYQSPEFATELAELLEGGDVHASHLTNFFDDMMARHANIRLYIEHAPAGLLQPIGKTACQSITESRIWFKEYQVALLSLRMAYTSTPVPYRTLKQFTTAVSRHKKATIKRWVQACCDNTAQNYDPEGGEPFRLPMEFRLSLPTQLYLFIREFFEYEMLDAICATKRFPESKEGLWDGITDTLSI